MSTLQAHFRSMARNNLWSNHRIHRTCAQLSLAELVEHRGAFFGSIAGTLNHIFLVDRWYFGRLTGTQSEPMLPHDTILHDDLGSLTAAQLQSDREVIRFCDSLDLDELARPVGSANTDGGQQLDPVHTVLAHLFLHQIHHRGQVHQMLCATSVSPPQLDEFLLSIDSALREAEVDELGLRS